MDQHRTVTEIERQWTGARWRGIARPYRGEDVYRLRGTLPLAYTLAAHGARELWRLLQEEPFVAVLSALSGNQAVQEVQAGLKAIYVSGWQVAADANTAMQMYPDQSLYPCDSMPRLLERVQNALRRADEIHHLRGDHRVQWHVPLVADAEAGFGGPLHAFELTKALIAAGAGGIHFEDQLSSVKKCGHLGGKVLVPTSEFITKLVAARLAADVCGVETVLIARTDALNANLLMSDIDECDRAFCTGARTSEGFHRISDGLQSAIARGKAYAPYADLLWFETSKPDLAEARQFAEAIHDEYPGKHLAYNCSPSFHWRRHLDDAQLLTFQRELGAMGYTFQFVTLSGFHAANYATFSLARDYERRGMAAYADLQEQELAAQEHGYEAVKHQEFVGVGYFDEITQLVSGGRASTAALPGSTEKAQFENGKPAFSH